MEQCSWPLGNGDTLTFNVHGLAPNWNNVAGLYIFAYVTDARRWRALYVGQTNDLSTRLPSHERRDEAIRKGATHIHAVSVPRAADRDKLEERLVKHLQPPMNEQLK